MEAASGTQGVSDTGAGRPAEQVIMPLLRLLAGGPPGGAGGRREGFGTVRGDADKVGGFVGV